MASLSTLVRVPAQAWGETARIRQPGWPLAVASLTAHGEAGGERELVECRRPERSAPTALCTAMGSEPEAEIQNGLEDALVPARVVELAVAGCLEAAAWGGIEPEFRTDDEPILAALAVHTAPLPISCRGQGGDRRDRRTLRNGWVDLKSPLPFTRDDPFTIQLDGKRMVDDGRQGPCAAAQGQGP